MATHTRAGREEPEPEAHQQAYGSQPWRPASHAARVWNLDAVSVQLTDMGPGLYRLSLIAPIGSEAYRAQPNHQIRTDLTTDELGQLCRGFHFPVAPWKGTASQADYLKTPTDPPTTDHLGIVLGTRSPLERAVAAERTRDDP